MTQAQKTSSSIPLPGRALGKAQSKAPNKSKGPGSFRKSPGPGGEAKNKPAAGLYVIATPIGHAQDITLRALAALGACDLIAAEDTRVTAKLLVLHGIAKPLLAYNDHNAARMRPQILERLRAGGQVALVSDAGTPLVSDPGFKLVRDALAEGLPVFALPGASAPLTALVLSGLPSDRFLFAGFLPSKEGERCSVLEELKSLRASLIFFESAQRLAESLATMAHILGPRPAAVGRELTKFHEEIRRADLATLAAHYAQVPAPKGEVTLVVGPPQQAGIDFSHVDAALDAALPFMPVKAAADMIAGLLDMPRRPVYARALARKSIQKTDG
jgi:16S rRNA (cytidine1402-2'-O)-methyltransferase